MLLAHRGPDVEEAFLGEVAAGAYVLDTFEATDVSAALTIIQRFRDLRIGLADASLLVLAARYDCADVLTLDERHFRVMTMPDGRPLRLLPADAAR